MLSKVREMIQVLPYRMGLMVQYALQTGLRPSECVESVRLLNSGVVQGSSSRYYYNEEQQTLEHFRFSQFLRPTKKAYISYLSTDNYQRIVELGPRTPTYSAIRHACNK